MKTARIKKGYGMVQRDIMISSSVSAFSKVVYALLVSYAGDNTTCFPSINTMCRNLQLSKPTIIKAITELKKENLVIVQKTVTKNGDYGNNVYEPLYLIEETEVVNDIDHGSQLDLLGVVKEVDPKNNTLRNNIEDRSFTSFWDLYDNKKKRIDTVKAWNKLTAKEKNECMNAIPKYILFLNRPEQKWQNKMYPASYLNGKCWEDEIPEESVNQNAGNYEYEQM